MRAVKGPRGSAGASPSQNPGFRTWEGSVRAVKGPRGSAGASPSQNPGFRTWEGSVRAVKGPRGSAGASPSQNPGFRTWEGSVRAVKGLRGSAGASPSQTWASELGRARLCPSRIMPRLAGRLAIPESCKGISMDLVAASSTPTSAGTWTSWPSRRSSRMRTGSTLSSSRQSLNPRRQKKKRQNRRKLVSKRRLVRMDRERSRERVVLSDGDRNEPPSPRQS